MKIEIGNSLPENFKEFWPGQYDVFSHYEYACSIPHVLFAISTLKQNGKPNICFHSWSCFWGDKNGFFAILSGISNYSHTYSNIMRTGEFCINFLSKQYFDGLMKTIAHNNEETDEFEAGGFTPEEAKTIGSPRIKESFLALECKTVNTYDISGAGTSSLIIGKVLHAAAEEGYTNGIDKRYYAEGFMYNIHSPQNLSTGEENDSAVATLKIEKVY